MIFKRVFFLKKKLLRFKIRTNKNHLLFNKNIKYINRSFLIKPKHVKNLFY